MIRDLTDLGLVDGRPVREAWLEDGDVRVAILSLGCITAEWRVAGRPVVLGYADRRAYLTNPRSMGIIAGRVANRIGGARFTLDGVDYQLAANEGANQLHGGPRGLGRRNWHLEMAGPRSVRLCYTSPDGEEGFPGSVAFTVMITLDGHALRYDMRGVPDRPTPINLAQHSYYNLSGASTVRDHEVWIAANAFTPVDGESIPTGEVAVIDGTHFDYRTPRRMQDADPSARGVDLNVVLDPSRDRTQPAAIVRADGLRLSLTTDQPGIQLYDAMHMGRTDGGHDGQIYDRHSGLCLEPQHFPDSPNKPQFPTVVCTPDAPYTQTLTVAIAPEG